MYNKILYINVESAKLKFQKTEVPLFTKMDVKVLLIQLA